LKDTIRVVDSERYGAHDGPKDSVDQDSPWQNGFVERLIGNIRRDWGWASLGGTGKYSPNGAAMRRKTLMHSVGWRICATMKFGGVPSPDGGL